MEQGKQQQDAQEQEQQQAQQEERSQPPEPQRTEIVDAGTKNIKKQLPSKLVVGCAILVLVVGGIIIMTNKGRTNSQPVHKPVTGQAQQKLDAERTEREQRQVEGLRDQEFFIRDERADTSSPQIFRGLDTEAPKAGEPPRVCRRVN